MRMGAFTVMRLRVRRSLRAARGPRAAIAAVAGLAGIATLALAQASLATHMPSDAEGHTTLEQRIVGGDRAGGAFSPLARAGGDRKSVV